MKAAASSPRLLTFASGGWVLLLTGLVCLGLIAWAVAPAVLRTYNRPPGDGENIQTYGFDLSNLKVPRELVSAGTLHRDMVPAMVNPTSHDAAAAQRFNDPKYGKYMVSSDRVIGVEINGEARAYPLHVLYVHEIVNDTLAGVPIAVTYNWLCDSAAVFDRRVGDRTLEFRSSGLLYNSNLVMYDAPESSDNKRTPEAQPEESLWSQLLAKAISGPAADQNLELTTINAEIALWGDWLERHPASTVLDREKRFTERYKDAAPTPYFQSDQILFPTSPPPPKDGPAAKTPVIAISIGDVRRVYPVPWLVEQAAGNSQTDASGAPMWVDQVDATALRFVFDRTMQTVRVEPEPADAPLRISHAFWFAWHAMYPQDELASADAGANSASR